MRRKKIPTPKKREPGFCLCDDEMDRNPQRALDDSYSIENLTHTELVLKLRRFRQNMANDLLHMMLDSKVVPSSLQELRPAVVPVTHSFGLSDATSIYHRCKRMPLKHNDFIEKELGMMLKEGIILPASSA